jgi:hypothetical protein
VTPPLARPSPRQVRRLDRLARRAHRFHRFAHHPLCEAYRGELIRLGPRALVCRGCALALAGAAAGLVSGALLADALVTAPPSPLLLGLALAVVVSAWRFAAVRSPAGPRVAKLRSRAAPALLAGFALALGLRAGTAPGLALSLVTVIAIAGGIAAYRRRGPDRAACEACAERTSRQPCSGFLRIARRERAFTRAATRILGERA